VASRDPGSRRYGAEEKRGSSRGWATVAAPFSSTLVPGEASESDSEPEPEPGGSAAGPPAAGLKLPGEASETEEEEEEEEEEDRAARVLLPGVPRGGPSLLQQRLGAGEGRLRGAMAEALGRGFSGAARLLEGLGGPLGRSRAGAAATAHCLCLVRRDLRTVAATVAACRLLPDIRGEP
ncbi:biogenesis of lysosome-related organelles complex 1 subunit 3-like, partial [Lagopus leucura]|uniref:biogenesis of lysosome-related organelles complex 1 subunit 3-like n=1 Tax=Lagopus leucura TaxID=30410 RepID=UPI001C66F11F